MYPNAQGYDMSGGAAPVNAQWHQSQQPQAAVGIDVDEGDNSHRPPNAFILYSQAMRSSVRQDNPSLSNTECSRLLGKMWKDVPSEIKMQYKQKAAQLQEEFKRQHPDYTYRKARRKRALNELLTKSTQGFPGFAGGDPSMMGMMGQNQFPMMQMYGQMGGMPGQVQPGQVQAGIPVMAGQMGIQAPQMQYVDPSMYPYRQQK